MKNEDLFLLRKKASILRAEGKYKETIDTCHTLLEAAKLLNDYPSIIAAYAYLAGSYYSIGAIEEAFHSIEAHEELCDKYGSENDKLHSFNQLFLLHEYTKDFEKGKSTLKKSIELGIKLKHYNVVSGAYSNYSHVCMVEENYAEALEMAKKGLELARLHEPASPILELRVKLNLTKATIELGDFETSSILIDGMINDPLLDSFIREKSNCYQLQGHWYTKQQRYREAFDSYTVAKELVESYNDLKLLKEIQEERCTLCDLMNDVQLGYTVQKEYILLLNTISDSEIALTARKLEILHGLSSMEKRANTDYLTGLHNRNYIEEKTNEWLKDAVVKKENIICIVFDIDNFKTINDEYGHLFGDEVIKQVAVDSLKIVKKNDLLARFGGDEFAIISRGISLSDGRKKAGELEKVLKNIRLEKDGKTISITASIGVSDRLSCSAMDFKELFNPADLALYKAKKNGKGQIFVMV